MKTPRCTLMIPVLVSECGCWEWQNGKTTAGYGHAYVNRKPIYAHRLFHELFKGPIPENYQIDHLCKNRCCVNPEHLEAVTHLENLMRSDWFIAKNAAKTHCPEGHPYSEENTRMVYGTGVTKTGYSRLCITCKRERDRVYKQVWLARRRERKATPSPNPLEVPPRER